MKCPECSGVLVKKPTKRAGLAQGVFECMSCHFRWHILLTSKPPRR